jgi:hypothetical protein
MSLGGGFLAIDCRIAPNGTKIPCYSLKKSLFLEIFSLLIFIGNCVRSHCSTAASCFEIVSQSPKNAKFPVKFPVSREFTRRQVRSALRRQPASPATGDFSLCGARNARRWRGRSSRQNGPRDYVLAGGAGARPDHPISGRGPHRMLHIGSVAIFCRRSVRM